MSGGLCRGLAGGLCKYVDEIGSVHPGFEFRWPLRYNGSPDAFNIRLSKSNDVRATPN